jgi:hypothetical protein
MKKPVLIQDIIAPPQKKERKFIFFSHITNKANLIKKRLTTHSLRRSKPKHNNNNTRYISDIQKLPRKK